MVFLLLLGSPARPAAVLALTRVPRDLDRGRVDLNPPGPLQLKKRRPEVSMPNSPPTLDHACARRLAGLLVWLRAKAVVPGQLGQGSGEGQRFLTRSPGGRIGPGGCALRDAAHHRDWVACPWRARAGRALDVEIIKTREMREIRAHPAGRGPCRRPHVRDGNRTGYSPTGSSENQLRNVLRARSPTVGNRC